MLISTGIPTKEDILSVAPSEERMAKGPCSIAECFQNIPCNPCTKACPRGAISMDGGINDKPKIDYEKCNGCGLCILQCPGLAIFTVDKSYSEKEAIVTVPYEYYPVPVKGDTVFGLNRAGEIVGRFEVTKVMHGNARNKTYAITVKVPKDLAMEVRNVKVGGDK